VSELGRGVHEHGRKQVRSQTKATPAVPAALRLGREPLTPSRIFLGQALARVSLDLLALFSPSACAAAQATAPGYVAAPFELGMALSWLADVLAALVYAILFRK
jgi:hypothetical protein